MHVVLVPRVALARSVYALSLRNELPRKKSALRPADREARDTRTGLRGGEATWRRRKVKALLVTHVYDDTDLEVDQPQLPHKLTSYKSEMSCLWGLPQNP